LHLEAYLFERRFHLPHVVGRIHQWGGAINGVAKEQGDTLVRGGLGGQQASDQQGQALQQRWAQQDGTGGERGGHDG